LALGKIGIFGTDFKPLGTVDFFEAFFFFSAFGFEDLMEDFLDFRPGTCLFPIVIMGYPYYNGDCTSNAPFGLPCSRSTLRIILLGTEVLS